MAEAPILETAPEPPSPFEMKHYDHDAYERRMRVLAAKVEPDVEYVLGGALFSVLRLADRILANANAAETWFRPDQGRVSTEGWMGRTRGW